MPDICIGSEFYVDDAGNLHLRVVGNPVQTPWPYACDPAVSNGLQIDPDAGVWVAPTPEFQTYEEQVTATPNFTITAGGTYPAYTIPDMQIVLTNPSACYPMTYTIDFHMDWSVLVGQSAQIRVAMRTEITPADPATTVYTPTWSAPPTADGAWQWYAQAHRKRPGVLDPGASITWYAAARWLMFEGAATVNYYLLYGTVFAAIGPRAVPIGA